MTPHEELLEHPQPVNKTAALHIAGGDRTGRDEMLWAQREAFERAMTDARLHNMEREQQNRREFARWGASLSAESSNSRKWGSKPNNSHGSALRTRVGVNQKLDEQLQAHTGRMLAADAALPTSKKQLKKFGQFVAQGYLP